MALRIIIMMFNTPTRCNNDNDYEVVPYRPSRRCMVHGPPAMPPRRKMRLVIICDGRTMVVGIDDGQTNGINFIPFVCPSRGVVVVGIDDGQTNGILLWGVPLL